MKKICKLKIPLIAVALLFLPLVCVARESFRVTQAFTARIDSALSEGVSLSIGYNDGLLVILPQDKTFIKALEIEIKSPALILNFPASMAYALYTGISPLPVGAIASSMERIIDFSGEKFAMETMPQKITLVLQIPLREGHGLKTDPYTEVLPGIISESSLPLFFRLFPIMKGLPDDFEKALFSVKVKPVLADEGGLALSIAFPEIFQSASSESREGVAAQAAAPLPLSVRIDEKPVFDHEKMQLLSHGEHHLAVSAEKCRTEVRTFTIERGRITRLFIELKDAAPTVSFASPSIVQVLLDGKPVPNPRGLLKIEPGRHTVIFFVGDYSLQRQFMAEEGRDYSVSMIVDAEIVELR